MIKGNDIRRIAIVRIHGVTFECSSESGLTEGLFLDGVAQFERVLSAMPAERAEMLRDELLIMGMSGQSIPFDDICDTAGLKQATPRNLMIRTFDPVLHAGQLEASMARGR